MKTLKKVLSVALVIAMAFSLVTMAGAAGKVSKYQDFTDANDIKNVEAVDMLTALGIINGMGDGSFAPKGNFTRAQAAKIIAYMLLGATTADNLRASVAPFSDVPASHWAAAYIQYCVSRGILNGLGDGAFNPDGQVTAAQFAKMLLTAIGYGKRGEYVGADWAINAIVDAQNLGILDTNADYMAPATRDEVARYAFNAFTNPKCFFVVLSKDTDGYEAAGGTNAGTLANQQHVACTDAVAQPVVNGFVSRQWFKNNVVLTGNWFAVGNQVVLATSESATTVSQLADPAQPIFYKAAADTSVSVYIDGTNVKTAGATPTYYNVSDANSKISTNGAGGVYVQLIDTNSNGKFDVVTVVTRKAYEVTAKTTVSAAGLVTIPGTSINGVKKELINGPTDFVRGDVAIVSEKDAFTGVYTVEKATKVQGQMTGSSMFGIAFAGGNYFAAANTAAVSATKSAVTFTASANISGNLNKNATAYVGKNGYIYSIKLDDATTYTTYGLVLEYQHYGSLSNSAMLRILKQDGTIAVYNQAPNAFGAVVDHSVAVGGVTNIDLTTNKFVLVAYEIVDGKIDLEFPTTVPTETNGAYTAKTGTINTDSGVYYLTNSTKIFYFNFDAAYHVTNNKGAVTTGYSKAVGLNADTKLQVVTGASNTVADVLVVDKVVTNISGGYKFAYATSAPNMAWGSTRKLNSQTVVDYTLYDGTEKVTLTSTVNNSGTPAFSGNNPGLYVYTEGSNGLLSSLTLATDAGVNGAYAPKLNYDAVRHAHADIVYVEQAGSYFVFNDEYASGAYVTKAVRINENTKIFEVANGVVREGTLDVSSTSNNEHGTHFKVLGWVENTDGVATQVYYSYSVSFAS